MVPFKLLPKSDNHSRQLWSWSQGSSQHALCSLVWNLSCDCANFINITDAASSVTTAFTILNFLFFDLELENTSGQIRQYNLQPTSSVNAKDVSITSEKSLLFQHAAKVVRVCGWTVTGPMTLQNRGWDCAWVATFASAIWIRLN